jgi:MbtH protein
MTEQGTSAEPEYLAVINHEEQYSIWAADREIPLGWRPAGCRGSRDECLDFIEQAWTDMRPLSVRLAMDAMAAGAVDSMAGAPGDSPA